MDLVLVLRFSLFISVDDYNGSLVAQRTYDQITATATRTYDDFGRLSSYVTANAGGDIVNFGYTYDADSNIISKQFNHRAGLANVYSYDTLDRVTGSDYGTVSHLDENFVYDTLGNRVTHDLVFGTDTVYAANNVNEYTSIGGTNVSYNTAGNLTQDHRISSQGNPYIYHYDYENRLTAIETTSGQNTVPIAAYAYDALGRRIESTGNLMGTYTFYYDGWRVLSEERNGENDVTYEYVYGNYLDEVCMLVSKYQGTDYPTYFAHDHLYSPVAWLFDGGSVVQRYEYNAYGQRKCLTAGYGSVSYTSNPISFTGQRQDDLDIDVLSQVNLSLMYYKNRYYDTETGRFLTRDPQGVQDGLALIRFKDALSPEKEEFKPNRQYDDYMSLYSYANSRPTVYIDSLGLSISFGCGTCGPDVTLLLDQLREKMIKDFNSLSRAKKLAKCTGRYGTNSWDVEQLHDPDLLLGRKGQGCATGACQETVMVHGRCRSSHAVNYYMYGIMHSLCSSTPEHDVERGLLWPILVSGDAKCKAAWARAGVRGNSSGVSCQDNLWICKPCLSSRTSPLTYRWKALWSWWD